MTTIAYRNGVLASDSRATVKSFVTSDRAKKIWRLSDGALVGFSGDYVYGLRLLNILKDRASQKNKKHRDLPIVSLKGTQGLLITPEKVIWLYDQEVWEKLNDKYYAIGTGGKYAMCAMDAGADAMAAAKIGTMRDVYSGGRIQRLKLKR